MTEEAYPDEPSDEDIKRIAEILPNSSPEEVLSIAKRRHERYKKIHEDELKRKELIKKISELADIGLSCSLGFNAIEAAVNIPSYVTDAIDRKERYIQIYGEEVYNEAVRLSQSSEYEIETCLGICVSNKRLRELEADIDKQPIINLNDVCRRTRGKEDKLPRKLRAGWKT